MKRLLLLLAVVVAAFGCRPTDKGINSNHDFITIDGPNLVAPDGTKFFIRGTNLGNWLNPEGYMFGFQRTNSAGAIDLMFRHAGNFLNTVTHQLHAE